MPGTAPVTEVLWASGDGDEGALHVPHRKSRMVDLRFFAGMTLERSADAWHVKRNRRFAKMWLLRELEDHPS
jgi:hypothetical protein